MKDGGPCDTERPDLLPVVGAAPHMAACHLPQDKRKGDPPNRREGRS